MALVNLTNIVVLDNPSSFTNPFTFEVTFECIQELEDDLEWKVLYVSSAEDAEQDQVLEEVMVGPVPVGVNKFVLQADAPDVSRIPEEDLVGVTVILITCSYREQEFVRVGYYVNNEYAEPFDPEVGPPKPIDLGKLVRAILADKPRVTRFSIDWGLGLEAPPPQTEEEAMAAEGGVMAMDGDGEEEMGEEEEEDDEEEEEEGSASAAAAGDESLGEDEEDEEDEEEEEGGGSDAASDEAEGLVTGDADAMMDLGSPEHVRPGAGGAASSSSAAAAAASSSAMMMESPPGMMS